MKAYWIYPETIGCFDKFDTKWISLCKALGCEVIPEALLVSPIETNQ